MLIYCGQIICDVILGSDAVHADTADKNLHASLGTRRHSSDRDIPPQYFNIMTPLNCTKRGLYNETHVQNNYTSYLKHLRQSCMDNNLYSTCRRPMASHVILPLV